MNESYFGSALRRRIIFLVIVGMIAIQTFQLINMQLLNSTRYNEKSKDNSIKTFPIASPRGIIFDRNFEILVASTPSFTMQITPSKYNQKNSRIIEAVLGVDSGYVSKLLQKYEKFSKHYPRTLMRGISYEVVSWIDENNSELPGVSYFVETKRDYSFGVNGAHIFGYTKEVDRETLQKNRNKYSIGDNIGFSGIEKHYEDYLRGEKGKEFYIVNSRQRIVSKLNDGLNDTPPVKGNDLVLALDRPTQVLAESLMAKYRGTAIAVDPRNGEILTYVSSPQFNLDDFADVTSNAIWDSLINDDAKPLFNRGTISMYPPGSIYKMVVAIAGLEEGIIKPSYTVNCNGGLQFGDRFFKCTHYHGKVDLNEAIAQSCNTYFYKIINRIGLDNLTKYSKIFHLGSETGIDISPESDGLIPSKDYYNRVFGKGKWSNGLLLNLSIGQGEIITTPIQLAQYTALLANSGITKTPHFAKGYIETFTNEFVPFEYDTVKVDVSDNSFKIIRNAMKDAVNSKNGTAFSIKHKDISISGKTGTAQNPHGKDHSIFIAYAPSESPTIAVAIIIENVGFGSTYAAPIAKKIIVEYLDKSEKEKLNLFNFDDKVTN